MKKLLMVVALLCVCMFTMEAVAQEHYTEGTVWRITLIRVKENQGDAYMTTLRESTKPLLEEQKKQGLILDYKVMLKETSENEKDWDIAICVLYKNHAALDGLAAKSEAIRDKVSSKQDAQQTGEKRVAMREIVSSFTVQEVTLK